MVKVPGGAQSPRVSGCPCEVHTRAQAARGPAVMAQCLLTSKPGHDTCGLQFTMPAVLSPPSCSSCTSCMSSSAVLPTLCL